MQVVAAWSVKPRLTRGQQAAHQKPDVPGEDPAFLTEVWKLWRKKNTYKALASNENTLTSTLSSTIYILVLMYNNFIPCNKIKENKANDCWWKDQVEKENEKVLLKKMGYGSYTGALYITHTTYLHNIPCCVWSVSHLLWKVYFSHPFLHDQKGHKKWRKTETNISKIQKALTDHDRETHSCIKLMQHEIATQRLAWKQPH